MFAANVDACGETRPELRGSQREPPGHKNYGDVPTDKP
jgi:hypothetical protein